MAVHALWLLSKDGGLDLGGREGAGREDADVEALAGKLLQLVQMAAEEEEREEAREEVRVRWFSQLAKPGCRHRQQQTQRQGFHAFMSPP